MKKLISIFLCIISCVVLTSCSSEPLPGEELISKAKEDFISLQSGKLTVTNADSGEIEQTFTFLLNKNDVMEYYFSGKNGDYEDAEYYDGETLIRLISGEKTQLNKDDKGFPEYNSKNRHPNASGDMILYQPNSIENVDIVEDTNETTITHTYSVNALNTKGSDSKVTSLVVTFRFDKDDNLIDITEVSETEKDGVTTNDTYVVAITEKNAITSVENGIE